MGLSSIMRILALSRPNCLPSLAQPKFDRFFHQLYINVNHNEIFPKKLIGNYKSFTTN